MELKWVMVHKAAQKVYMNKKYSTGKCCDNKLNFGKSFLRKEKQVEKI